VRPTSPEGGPPGGASEQSSLPSIRAEMPHSDSTGVVLSKDEGFGQAVEESLAEAVDQENSDIAEAMMRSKADAPVVSSGDGVIMLRLDRRARAQEVTDALLEAPALAACRARVEEAGCELQPEWAGGAWLLLPMTKEMYEETGLRTGPKHLLMLSQDEVAVRHALKTVPYKKRPQLRSVLLGEDLANDPEPITVPPPEEIVGTAANTDGKCESSGGPNSRKAAAPEDDADVPAEIVVERTFLTVKLGQGGTARDWHSAPSRLECDMHSE